MRLYRGLLGEIIVMALDTLRLNKLRSALTVLGVVIGITAIVGMTSLIRGFDQSLRDSIRTLGPDTIFIAQFSGVSLASGRDVEELLKRPSLTIADARAIEQQASAIRLVDIMLGGAGGPGPGQRSQERLFHENERTPPVQIVGTTENYPDVQFLEMAAGRFFTASEVQHRRPVIVLGKTPGEALFPNGDPIGKVVRLGPERYTVVGVLGPRPSMGGLNAGQDEIAIIPQTTYQKQFGIRAVRVGRRGELRNIFIAAVPSEGVPREQAMRQLEEIMRVRHGLRLDEPNDFDLVTQDAVLAVWDQISRATFLGLVVISSIALMVGGIGVMAIMMISVTERTREIGVRKALGARRQEILWQFLIEAVVLTSIGGVLGIVLGSAVGLSVHFISGFPVSLPWWSFALGIGFSASVGVLFGMIPAVNASRLDPIEALRYE
jgi:putative ABC transport system permease protein